MRLKRIFFSVLFAAACTVPGAAQSAKTQPLAHDFTAAHDSRAQLPELKIAAKTRPKPPQVTVLMAPSLPPADLCYAIRSYNYGPVTSLAEAPKPTDSTTCVAAANNKLKSAGGVRVLR